MNKQDYLHELKRNLRGLPTDQVAEIMQDYEQHFVDAAQAGRTEDDIARGLGEPRKIAREFKVVMHLDAFQNKRSLDNLARLIMTLLSMAIFNLFLLPFAMIFPLLLLSSYLLSAGCFIGGIAIALSGVSGVREVAFTHNDTPEVVQVLEAYSGNLGININDAGPELNFYPYSVRIRTAATARVDVSAAQIAINAGAMPAVTPAPSPTQQDSAWRRGLIGIAYIVAGIAAYFFSRYFAKFMWIGVTGYLRMNVNILRKSR